MGRGLQELYEGLDWFAGQWPEHAVAARTLRVHVGELLRNGRPALDGPSPELAFCLACGASRNQEPVYAGHGEGEPYATGDFRCGECRTLYTAYSTLQVPCPVCPGQLAEAMREGHVTTGVYECGSCQRRWHPVRLARACPRCSAKPGQWCAHVRTSFRQRPRRYAEPGEPTLRLHSVR
jgi:hypothetical protein